MAVTTGVTSGAKTEERTACDHDSMRLDALLDDHCMKCGASGYWHHGIRHDKAHPSGKILFSLEGLSG
jgi:hypothetical protein